MAKLGQVKLFYLGDNDKKKSAAGIGEDNGAYIEVKLIPSKRRKKFNIILIPWNRVIKIIIME